jgi:hypothetical protein
MGKIIDRIMDEARPHPVCGGLTSDRKGTRRGYVQIDIGEGVKRYRHRLIWEHFRGPIPDGIKVLHRCDQPDCFDVRHLFIGTIADNNADRDAKGRGVVPDTRGVRHGLHKLTDEQVIAIYRSILPGKLLAAEHGVARSCISKIKNGHAWRHLTSTLGDS